MPETYIQIQLISNNIGCKMQNASQQNEEISLYKKRWFLLIALCLYAAICMFLSKSFGTSDEILAAYFNASLIEIDWAMEGLYGGVALVTPIFAYLCYKDQIGFRVMSIIGTICLLTSNVAIVLSIIFPVLFPLMLVSTVLQGVAYAISRSASGFFAVLWFPEEQVDVAVALVIASVSIGVLSGSTLPVIFLKQPPQINETTMLVNASAHWNASTYRTLLCMYSVVIVILVCLLIFFIVYASDLPPKPPTYVMLLKRQTDQLQRDEKTFFDFLTLSKSLFADIHFGIIAFVLNIAFATSSLLLLIVSQIVDVVTADITLHVSPALLSGLIVVTNSFAAIVSSFVGANCLKFFEIYKKLSVAGTFVLLVGGSVLFLSYHYKSLVVLFIANVILGIGSRCVVVPLLVVITRHTYPVSETFVSIWVAGFGALVFVLLAVMQRVLSNAFSLRAAIFQLIFVQFVSFISSLLMRPKNKRKEAQENAAIESNELTPILTSRH